MTKVNAKLNGVYFYLLFLSLLSFSCTSKEIIRDKEYKKSVSEFKRGEYHETLNYFPKKEKDGFITSVEKNWIRFWLSATGPQPVTSELEKQVKTFDARKFISISREAEYFFYQEAEEGYIPSEHEVIVLHLLSAMSYLKNKNYSEAAVEARRAGYYLQGIFNENQPHFDDPGLRLWLAGIWTLLGEWDEAQVDLRRAYELSPQPELLKLSQRKQPPAEFSLVFSGVGPELKWIDNQVAPEFLKEESVPLSASAQENKSVGFSTHPWFARHALRNSALRDQLLKSNYMAQFLEVKLGSGADKVMSKAVTTSLRLAGLLVGGVVVVGGVYLLAQAPGASGEVLSYAFAAGTYLGYLFWKKADKEDLLNQIRIDKNEKTSFEDMRAYRFVRFMPNWVSLNWDPKFSCIDGSRVQISSPDSKTKVSFIHCL